jgi:hypothetical protein
VSAYVAGNSKRSHTYFPTKARGGTRKKILIQQTICTGLITNKAHVVLIERYFNTVLLSLFLRCVVQAYKTYAAMRPAQQASPHSPFYIACNTRQPGIDEKWFVNQRMGKGKISQLMKRIAVIAGIDERNLSAHSARKTSVQKMMNKNIPPTDIIQITGHKNPASLNSYGSLPKQTHRQISSILSHTRTETKGRSTTQTNMSQSQTIIKAPESSSTATKTNTVMYEQHLNEGSSNTHNFTIAPGEAMLNQMPTNTLSQHQQVAAQAIHPNPALLAHPPQTVNTHQPQVSFNPASMPLPMMSYGYMPYYMPPIHINISLNTNKDNEVKQSNDQK